MKFDAKVKIKTMSPTNTITQTIEGAELTDMRLRSYMLGDNICAECMKVFDIHETVVTIMPSMLVKEDGQPSGFSEYSIPLDKFYLLHITNNKGNTCLEDFMARFISSHTVPDTENKDNTNAGNTEVKQNTP